LGYTDFREVKGQEHVKRALEVAAAGEHNVLAFTPPADKSQWLTKKDYRLGLHLGVNPDRDR